MDENAIAEQVIGAAIEVHRALGPGLLESAYQRCLAHEFSLRGIPFEQEVAIGLSYKGLTGETAYRAYFCRGRPIGVRAEGDRQAGTRPQGTAPDLPEMVRQGAGVAIELPCSTDESRYPPHGKRPLTLCDLCGPLRPLRPEFSGIRQC